MKIGELARLTQSTVETVRYYEKEGLLPPTDRTSGNFRVYGPAHLERLRFVRNCRALGMSHEDIHNLLRMANRPAQGCGAVNAVFDKHIAHVDARIQELAQLKAQLAALRHQCQSEQVVETCGILQGLAAMAPAKTPAKACI